MKSVTLLCLSMLPFLRVTRESELFVVDYDEMTDFTRTFQLASIPGKVIHKDTLRISTIFPCEISRTLEQKRSQ